MNEIIIPYKPRDVFRAYHASLKRFSVTVAHRRAGKTVARINKLIKKAVQCVLPNPRFGYLAPFYVQAKDIAWLYLKQYASPLLELGGRVNESELSITLPHNDATIKLYGAENAERMRGLYFDGIVADEAQGMAKATLTTIILPCLADRQGWLDTSGTPKGWSNLLGELVKMAKADPEWFLQILKASETQIIPESELKILRAMMSDNEYAQEFECDFDAAITGAVYGRQIAQMDADKRIKAGIYDPELDVRTAWDLGYDDATSIVFWQLAVTEVRIIDCYENSGMDIAHYCDILAQKAKEKGYRYGAHYVPHDAANKLLAAGGRSIVQQAYELGVKMFVVAATSQMNGIEALRKLLGQTWIDPSTCEPFLDAMKQYQFEFDQERQSFRSIPRHDWSSHFCDAAEIIGQVMRKPLEVEEPTKPKFFEQATANDVFWGELEQSKPLERI